MVRKVTPSGDVEDRDVTDYAVARWDRTLRLCVIRLSEAAPAYVPLVWLIMRR
jgi:hypothetical protein